MNEPSRQHLPDELLEIYAKLSSKDVEQFYAGYHLWSVQQQIAALEDQMNELRRRIAENAARMQEARPSAIGLAAIARLQASGVNNIDLLDRMLERGEDWLDRTMQRLDYCEQLSFIGVNGRREHDDYTQWCEHALEGAYDWIDSLRNANSSSSPSASLDQTQPVAIEVTEEILLEKLTSNEAEEQYTSIETFSTTQESAPQNELLPLEASSTPKSKQILLQEERAYSTQEEPENISVTAINRAPRSSSEPSANVGARFIAAAPHTLRSPQSNSTNKGSPQRSTPLSLVIVIVWALLSMLIKKFERKGAKSKKGRT